MPRPLTRPKPRALGALALTCGVLALPPDVLREALAATAGTLFEAAPLLLAASFARPAGFRTAVALAGCGCRAGAVPGALSIPATVLCWLSFGPLVAGVRVAAGLGLAVLSRRGVSEPAAQADVLLALEPVAVCAFAGSLAAAWLRQGGAPGAALSLVAGALAGLLAPCATAGVALAAALRAQAPWAAVAILATCGLVPAERRAAGRSRALRAAGSSQALRPARLPLAALAVASCWLVAAGGRGYVNPRLVPLVALGGALAGGAVLRGGRSAATLGCALPFGLAALLALGPPEPALAVSPLDPDDVAVGSRARFSGRLMPGARLVRYRITCCRADATALGLRLDRIPRVALHAWAEADGTIGADARGLYLRVARTRAIAAPVDPFIYR